MVPPPLLLIFLMLLFVRDFGAETKNQLTQGVEIDEVKKVNTTSPVCLSLSPRLIAQEEPQPNNQAHHLVPPDRSPE